MISYSIIIPARNEAALIADTLRYLIDGSGTAADRVRILLICNGCTDATAERARATGLPVEIVELATGGKSNAINHGLGLAPDGPVFVMDADIRMRLSGFDAMAGILIGGEADAISPAPHFQTSGSAAAVRRYFRVYARHPYLARGVGGAGVWGISAAARAALGQLPDIIADDNYIRARFPAERQVRIAFDRETGPLVQVPRTRADLLRCESRWRSGDAQIAALPDPAIHADQALFRPGDLASAMRRNWSDPAALLTYLGIKLLGRGAWIGNRARRRHHIWHRDETSRRATPAATN